MEPAPRRMAPASPGWRGRIESLVHEREDSAGFLVAAILSLGAGALHLAYTPDHFAIAVAHGLFFLTLGFAQIGWGIWILVRPGFWSTLLGPAIACASIFVYVLSLLLAPPFVDHAEALEYAGLATKVAEAATVVVLAAALLHPRPAAGGGALAFVALAVGSGLVLGGVAVGVGYGLEPIAPALGEGETHMHEEEPHGHNSTAGAGLFPRAGAGLLGVRIEPWAGTAA